MIYAPEHVVVFIQQYTTRMLLYQIINKMNMIYN